MISFYFSTFYLAAKLRLSIVTTASAAVIYHKCSCYLDKTDFDQYVHIHIYYLYKFYPFNSRL